MTSSSLGSFATYQIDSHLGCWTITEWRPPHLASVVEAMWHFDGVVGYPRERVFPSGIIELIVHLGERYREVEGDRAGLYSTTCVTGMQLGPMVIEAPSCRNAVMGIRLHPAGAYVLLGSLAQVSGLSVDLQDLVGRSAGELAERCHATASPEERLRIAGRWIGERVKRVPGADPAVSWMASQIRLQEGAVSISELREHTGFSKTRLVTAFRDQIGVTPKLYARIVRFRRVLDKLIQGAGPLSELALEAGYYDQPHMNAEFRELSGFTPRELLAATRYPNTPSLAETPS